MAAPKTGLNLGGSKEYLKRRKAKRERLEKRSFNDPSDDSFGEALEMGEEDDAMEGEVEAEEIFRKFQGKRTADEAATALAKKKRK